MWQRPEDFTHPHASPSASQAAGAAACFSEDILPLKFLLMENTEVTRPNRQLFPLFGGGNVYIEPQLIKPC